MITFIQSHEPTKNPTFDDVPLGHFFKGVSGCIYQKIDSIRAHMLCLDTGEPVANDKVFSNTAPVQLLTGTFELRIEQ